MATTNLFGTFGTKVPITPTFSKSITALKDPTKNKPAGFFPQPESYYSKPQTPSVMGASTKAGTTGGNNVVSGGFEGLAQDAAKQGLLQKQQSQPSSQDFDSIIAPALNALSGYQKSLESNLPGIYSNLEGQSQIARNNLNQSATDISGRYNQQRTQANQTAESAVAEARRGFAELQRGLQAQYGGTTGTGAFSAELAGRGTLGNINNIRIGLQDTMMQITDAEESLKRDVQNKMFELDQNLNSAKEQARMDLMEKIQQINLKKGELESNKAQQKMDAMREYKITQAQIEASNKQFLQGLYGEYQNKLGVLSKAKDQAVSNLDIGSLNMGDIGGFVPTEQKPATPPQGDIRQIQQDEDPLGLGL